MSLDLHIKSKTPILKHGTGVYVREKGRTRELESLAEVTKYFQMRILATSKNSIMRPMICGMEISLTT